MSAQHVIKLFDELRDCVVGVLEQTKDADSEIKRMHLGWLALGT